VKGNTDARIRNCPVGTATTEGSPSSWAPTPRMEEPAGGCRSIDNKRALKGYSRNVPGHSQFTGHFLDLRTAAFAPTGTGHTLRSAGEAFNTSALKSGADGHGDITPDYIDYSRNDTAATAALLERVLTEFGKHPIGLMPTLAFSPASIAKAYLDAMGTTPLIQRCPDVPDWVHAAAMEAFYGGRAECRIRKVPAPVALVDFTSMYATVDTLMGLFDLLTAERIDVDTEAAAEVQQLLDSITEDDCFNQDRWRDVVGLVQFQPDGQVLPVRADYQPRLTGNHADEPDDAVAGVSYGIGVNPFTATQPLWYTIPDVIATTLHHGRAPRVLKAIRLRPAGGKLDSLRPVRLRGEVVIDPREEDFFARVVEQRQTIRHERKTTRRTAPARIAPQPPSSKCWPAPEATGSSPKSSATKCPRNARKPSRCISPTAPTRT
jgi:hypothetical protein